VHPVAERVVTGKSTVPAATDDEYVLPIRELVLSKTRTVISLTVFSLVEVMARVWLPSLMQKVSFTIVVSPLFCEVDVMSSPAQDERKRHRDSSSTGTEREYRV
jgi:hypothetical protein